VCTSALVSKPYTLSGSSDNSFLAVPASPPSSGLWLCQNNQTQSSQLQLAASSSNRGDGLARGRFILDLVNARERPFLDWPRLNRWVRFFHVCF
jgi:hypothetical protein